eukprot:m.92932 g.92932  ORF g.92932 m.92932 type:complete len:66 (+) comp16526_c0_seq4:2320-2517(+)
MFQPIAFAGVCCCCAVDGYGEGLFSVVFAKVPRTHSTLTGVRNENYQPQCAEAFNVVRTVMRGMR